MTATLGTAAYVHPQASCESDDVGPGTRIWAFAQVLAGAHVGTDCNICGQTFIESGAVIGNGVTIKNGVSVWDLVTIEDDVFVGPNATFTNDLRPRAFVKRGRESLVPTRVRRGATIGANATVVCGLTVGAFAMVGAGAVVTADVPAHALVVGSPARRIGWVCRCGERLDERLACASCGLSYEVDADGGPVVTTINGSRATSAGPSR